MEEVVDDRTLAVALQQEQMRRANFTNLQASYDKIKALVAAGPIVKHVRPSPASQTAVAASTSTSAQPDAGKRSRLNLSAPATVTTSAPKRTGPRQHAAEGLRTAIPAATDKFGLTLLDKWMLLTDRARPDLKRFRRYHHLFADALEDLAKIRPDAFSPVNAWMFHGIWYRREGYAPVRPWPADIVRKHEK